MENSKELRIKILHITPHLGGGVGRVLLNFITNSRHEYVHRVCALDYLNDNAKEKLRQLSVVFGDLLGLYKHNIILSECKEADVVIVHWWNHPLLYNFLVREVLPPCRIIIWSHVSGLYAPNIFTKKLLNYPDKFVFTTPISLKSDAVIVSNNSYDTIWSTGGLDHINKKKPSGISGVFNIGYVGTVDYAKMHNNFLDMTGKINVPNKKFTVCGKMTKEFESDLTIRYHNYSFIKFTGEVSDVSEQLNSMHVFGYPLTKYHYGTCEQALGEAMYAGVVPVVMNNLPESCIVEDGVNGLVAKNEDEYMAGIHMMYEYPKYARLIAEAAVKKAKELYNTKKMINKWRYIINNAINIQKTSKQWIWDKPKIVIPYNIYMESLGEYRECKSSGLQWVAQTRGTPQHYLNMLGEDIVLRKWSEE